ncbi:23S rRNA (pseudouridine(1915)-N(3))-methyltransferase RlmH [Alkalibaculum sp. M08DMB]|uniref:Ribosomal RNA large subunit methyltransferase H n=1 Tax=Alkalibaculum sporogenes TaxID=2655001 RepID=A0A6A7KBV7_9FIRM|nr:23S rRNA (pseudouridine(1915)-N(3))-methyltransferase RlmH [Alkalibaculum sporogenes]MPW26886.1 23S rRNA (pseudouridine(1915)-N(3))-methyltransferase RlmH [Alkalibaculum sporogenes]
MNITIIAVGKIKEKFYAQAIEEYVKRLGRYCNLKTIEIPDEKAPENLSNADRLGVIEKEGKKILSKIPLGPTIITMEIEGKQISSVELSKQIEEYTVNGQSHLCFIIGGSLGLSEEIKRLSQLKLSFSKMTFPHQLFRVMLLEQIYRGFRIFKGEPYHK